MKQEEKQKYFDELINKYLEAKKNGETDSIGVWAACYTDIDGDNELFGDFLIYVNSKQI